MDWRIYYDDGSTYSSEDGCAENAPAFGVQAIVQRDFDDEIHNVGRYVLSSPMVDGNDYYWFERGAWYGGEIFGLWDYLSRLGPRKVIFGRVVEKGRFREIRDRAMADPDFPRYSGA